jgi:hypothetical protein
MRDDLHHSLPQTSPWRAAVRAARLPELSGNLADAVTRAAWSSGAAWWNTAWGHELRSLLGAKQVDMFGQERIERSLEVLERSCPDHSARRACEIARASVMNCEASPNLGRQVIHAAIEACAEDGIELAASRIAAEHPEYQAKEVWRRLREVLPYCNLGEPPAPKRRQRRKSVEDGLRISLHSTF